MTSITSTLLTTLVLLALGASSFADAPQISLDFEALESAETIHASGSWGIQFNGKNFLGQDAKNGQFCLKGNLIAIGGNEEKLAQEFNAFSTAAWVKIKPSIKSGTLFIRLVRGDGTAGDGRMKVLLTPSVPNHYCVTLTVHAAGAQDERTYSSEKVELPSEAQWIHIAVVFSEQQVAFYCNGELISETQTIFETIPALSGSPAFYVGGGDTNLDDWSFYDRALPQGEIYSLMESNQ